MRKNMEEPGTLPMLEVARVLFAELERSGVKYCHWKSNQHLEAAIAGLTDIDILVAKEHAAVFLGIIHQLNFKRFISPSWKTYPGIEDYLGFDYQSGALIHLHVHYELIVGIQYVKGHRIPYEKVILETAIRQEPSGVKIIDPNIELILLWIRLALKLRFIDLARVLKRGIRLAHSLQLEFAYLEDRVTPDEVYQHLVVLLGPTVADRLRSIILRKNSANIITLLQFRMGLGRNSSRWRIYGLPAAIGLYYWRYFQKTGARLGASIFKLPPSMSKRCAHGGLVIACVGADGSGKSTVTSALQAWLSWKIDTHRLYFGSGDGSVNMIFRMRKRLKELVTSSAMVKPGTPTEALRGKWKKSWMKDWFDGVTLLSLAQDKYVKLRKARRLAARGAVIVTDRYPQDEVHHINDGPKIGRGRDDSRIRSYFSQKELAIYRKMAEMPADLVVKLMITADVALTRKPEHQRAEIERKVSIVECLQFGGARIVAIDANQTLDTVVLETKRAVWEAL